jgi:hypothetical protein
VFEKSVEPSLTTVSQINDQCITFFGPLQAAESGDLERILAEKSKKVGSELRKEHQNIRKRLSGLRLDLQFTSISLLKINPVVM